MLWIPGGFLGVEVFFVISGYLITLLLTASTRATVDDLAARLLDAPRPPPARRRLRAAGHGLGGRARLLPRGRVQAGRPGLGRADLRHELVPDLLRPVVLRRCRAAARVPAPVVAGDRGAVLPGVAAAAARPAARVRRPPPADRRGHHAGAIASLVWMAVLFEPAMDPSRAYYGTDTRASGLLLGAALALVWKPGHVRSRRRGQAGRPRPRSASSPSASSSGASADRRRPTRSSTAAGSPSCRSPRAWRSPPPSTPARASAGCSASRCWSGSASGRTRCTCGTGRSSCTPSRRSTSRWPCTRRSCCASRSPSSPPS